MLQNYPLSLCAQSKGRSLTVPARSTHSTKSARKCEIKWSQRYESQSTTVTAGSALEISVWLQIIEIQPRKSRSCGETSYSEIQSSINISLTWSSLSSLWRKSLNLAPARRVRRSRRRRARLSLMVIAISIISSMFSSRPSFMKLSMRSLRLSIELKHFNGCFEEHCKKVGLNQAAYASVCLLFL